MEQNNREQMYVVVSVELGDALNVPADVLALKYAQAAYGVDSAVIQRLASFTPNIEEALPIPGKFTLVKSDGQVASPLVLFVGVVPLLQFGYQEIRVFGRDVLMTLAKDAPDTKHLCLTIHGPGYGLDEAEAFEAEVAGIVEAITDGDFPQYLERITIIEQNSARVGRLRRGLSRLLPQGRVDLNRAKHLGAIGSGAKERLRSAGYNSKDKPHVFVAMPFLDEMSDTYDYGIQSAVHAAGFLCERADVSTFTGDAMEWVRRRIASATLVIADLSTANPNVYLEVGYAWGCGKPTILLARDISELKFDVKGQRCLLYKRIKHLEELLKKELENLRPSLPI